MADRALSLARIVEQLVAGGTSVDTSSAPRMENGQVVEGPPTVTFRLSSVAGALPGPEVAKLFELGFTLGSTDLLLVAPNEMAEEEPVLPTEPVEPLPASADAPTVA